MKLHAWLCSALALTCVSCGSSSSQSPSLTPGAFNLTVLHNNNADSALLPQGDFGGISRFATVVANQRSLYPSSLLLSAGDILGANPEFRASQLKGVPFYDSLAFNLLGYAASGVGSSEFFFGPETLGQFLAALAPPTPFVSSNLSPIPGVTARTVVTVGGRRIGLVGVTDPDLAFRSSPMNVTAGADLAAAAQPVIDALQADGVDIVITLAGLDGLNAARALTRSLRGSDLTVAAGLEVLANAGTPLVPGDQSAGAYPLFETDRDGLRVPVVTAGSGYRYLGRLTLSFDGAGRLQQVDPSSGPVRVAGGTQPDAVQPDPTMLAQVETPVAQDVARAAAQVVAATQVELDGLAGDLRERETNLGDLLADAILTLAQQKAAGLGQRPPVAALVNSGALRQNRLIPVGNLTGLDLQEIAPFASFVVLVPNLSPAQVKELLENSVSKVEVQDARFAQIAGLRLVWDPAGRAQQVNPSDGTILVAGTRVRELSLADGTALVRGGTVVAGAPNVDLATLDFTARGGDEYPFRGAVSFGTGVTYQDALAQYLTTTLGGVVSAARYPAAGTGRITTGP